MAKNFSTKHLIAGFRDFELPSVTNKNNKKPNIDIRMAAKDVLIRFCCKSKVRELPRFYEIVGTVRSKIEGKAGFWATADCFDFGNTTLVFCF